MSSLLVFTKRKTPRVLYIVDFILGQLCDFSFSVTDNIEEYKESNKLKINYSEKKILAGEFFLPPHSLLFQNTIEVQDTNIANFYNLPCLFAIDTDESDFPFDILAASFWLLTRYEEYLPTPKDSHGRFAAHNCLAKREKFLHLPIIQLWTKHFAQTLCQQFKPLSYSTLPFKFKPSYDIDMAWSYREKGLIRTVGGILSSLKNGKFQQIIQRLQVLSGSKKDPFDSYALLDEIHDTYKIYPLFFFLLGDFGEFDKNINPKNKALQSIVQKIHQKYLVGIHPSYASNAQSQKVAQEILRLKKITGEKVTHSRQHFLKLTFPDTYRQLIKCGIKNDYSMGYAAEIGYRAGVGVPFFWYDLKKEIKTDLRVHPFQVMDVSLRFYLKYSCNEALKVVTEMIKTQQKVGGTFMTLWHNSSFAEEDGWSKEWQDLYLNIVKRASGHFSS